MLSTQEIQEKKRSQEIELINRTIAVIQEGYVKPDMSNKGGNTSGVVRDAKFARPLYNALLDRLAELHNVEESVQLEKEKENRNGRNPDHR